MNMILHGIEAPNIIHTNTMSAGAKIGHRTSRERRFAAE
jgi:hypothetical protein